MDGSGDEFLPGSCLAFDEDSGIDARHIADELIDLHHGRGASDKIVELRLVIELLPQMVEFCAIMQQDDAPLSGLWIRMDFIFDPSRSRTRQAKGALAALRHERAPCLAQMLPVCRLQRETLFPRLTDDRRRRALHPGKAARADEGDMAFLIRDDGGQIQMLEKRQDIVAFLGSDGK